MLLAYFATSFSSLCYLSEGTASSAPFLSQMDYDSYYVSEECFTGVLTAYTRKQFFEVGTTMCVCKGGKEIKRSCGRDIVVT